MRFLHGRPHGVAAPVSSLCEANGTHQRSNYTNFTEKWAFEGKFFKKKGVLFSNEIHDNLKQGPYLAHLYLVRNKVNHVKYRVWYYW